MSSAALIETGRLLIITPFGNSVNRVTQETAEQRNRFMVELADEVVIGYVSKGGILERLVAKIESMKVISIQE